MGRALCHVAGAAFVAGVVSFFAKWAFVAGLAGFGAHVWETRPGVEERERRAEQALRERLVTSEEGVVEAVNRASAVTLHLVERRSLLATVEARNPTATSVDLEAVRCRVLFSPDGGQPRDVSNRAPWRVRLEPGAAHRGEVSFSQSDVLAAKGIAPVTLAEYRCGLRVRLVPQPTAPPGSPSNPIKMSPGGYRG